MSRGALFVGASVVVAVSNCSAYGQCPIAVDLESPCGFLLVESTCSDGIPICTKTGKLFTSCRVQPKSDCKIAVMLGDGTEQTLDVKVDRCVSPGFVSFACATCVAQSVPDAGAKDVSTDDAEMTDADTDATNDATSDALTTDATSE